MIEAKLYRCHCGSELKQNQKEDKIFVLCLDCGHFQEETQPVQKEALRLVKMA
jgi:hypothetical protein